MKSGKSIWWWGGGLIIFLVFLFSYPKLFGNQATAPGTSVPCIINNLPLIQHIHPILVITVDGTNETIPANIGLGGACERAVHTHDTTGQIHVEAQDARQYTLGDFMSVWGKSINREGYILKTTADGAVITDPQNLIFKDSQQIELEYSKVN